MSENTNEPKYIYDLNDEEKEFIIRYRLLSEENKQRVMDYVIAQRKNKV